MQPILEVRHTTSYCGETEPTSLLPHFFLLLEILTSFHKNPEGLSHKSRR